MTFRFRSTSRRVAMPLRRHVAVVAILILGLCGTGLIWGVILHSGWVARAMALDGATRDAVDVARAFADKTEQTVAAIDQTLMSLRRAYLADPAGFSFGDWSRNMRAIADVALVVAVVDQDGTMVAANIPDRDPLVKLRDRPYFTFQKNAPGDDLFIGTPVRGRADKLMQIQFSRRITAPDGTFAGVVLVGLDEQFITRLYDTFTLGRDGTLGLIGFDGVLRARAGGPTEVNAGALGQTWDSARFVPAYRANGAGVRTDVSEIDGIRRLWAYRRVGDFPLLVTAGVAIHDALASSRAEQRKAILLGCLLTTLIAALAVLCVRRVARSARA